MPKIWNWLAVLVPKKSSQLFRQCILSKLQIRMAFLVFSLKKYWNIVSDQIVSAIRSFFREGWMLQQCNHTFITLIPKKAGICNFNHFRPISLCNFYYKVIAKILVSRLRPLLSKIIDPAQGAFVP